MKTIVWDVDDVLNDLMRSWFEEKWLVDHPGCGVRYEELVENTPHRLLGVGVDEYLKSLDKYRLSPSCEDKRPVKEVEEWFLEYGSSYRHVCLTAVPLVAAPTSARWVFRHFGKWIRTFHFTPSMREGRAPEYDRDKAAFLRWVGKVDVMVDDRIENVEAAEGMGIRCLLMPRPWNRARGSVAGMLAALNNCLGD